MISDIAIKAIRNQNLFRELRDHILEEVQELDSVSGMSELSNSRAGEEAKIREKTRDKLIKIFRPFVDFSEKTEPSIESIQKVKSRTGL